MPSTVDELHSVTDSMPSDTAPTSGLSTVVRAYYIRDKQSAISCGMFMTAKRFVTHIKCTMNGGMSLCSLPLQHFVSFHGCTLHASSAAETNGTNNQNLNQYMLHCT